MIIIIIKNLFILELGTLEKSLNVGLRAG